MAALVAFDTATDRLHIGLALDKAVWLHDSEGGASASSTLIPSLRRLLTEAGVGWQDLDAIAFGRGPGAFTGLRTACATAQGLALGAHKPVLPIDTLMAVAEDARERAGVADVWVVMDARMDEIYAAHFRWSAGLLWQSVVAPALYTPEGLHDRWRELPPRALAGSAAFDQRLDPAGAEVVADAQPRGRALLACAGAAWARGGAIDAALALPLYVRDRVALTTAEREARRSAGAPR